MGPILNKLSKTKIRLLFSTMYFIVLAFCLLNAFNILFWNAFSNDQCAWRNIEGKDDALLITDIVPGGVADEAGIKEGDLLLKINGKGFSVSDPAKNAMLIVNAIPRGGHATYLIERDGRQFEVQVRMLKVFDISFLANLLLGLGFFIVGYIVVMTRPDGFVQRLFGFYALLSMMLFALNMIMVKDFAWARIPLIVLASAARILGPALFIIFFFYFPVVRKVKIVRLIFILILFLNGALALCLLLQVRTVAAIAAFSPHGFFIAGLVIFAHSYFRYVEKERRKQLRAILICSVAAVASFVYTVILSSVNPFVVFIKPVLLVPSLLLLLLPVSFGYSIFKYRLMDIDLIVKKSIVYGIVTFMLALVYFTMVFGLGTLIGNVFEHKDNQALSIIALVVIAFIFDPLKRRVQDWVDKIFYRDKNAYQTALLEFSRILPLQLNVRDILNSVVNTIASTMHIDRAAGVLIGENGQQICFSKNVPDELCNYSREPRGIINLLSKIKEPINATILKDDRYYYDISEEELDKVSRSGIELIVPMMVKNKVIGFINTGKKLSEKPYSNDDIEVLKIVANQAAVAVENGRLHEKEKTLYKVQEELKLASQIQTQWLPKVSPQVKGFEIAGFTQPARTVGGDYFDYIEIDNDKLGICVGDVSGKGLPAALMMANVQAILRSQAIINLEPDSCLQKTNRLIYESSTSEMFVTLFYSILDSRRKTLTYSNAGHNYPLLYSSGKGLTNLKDSNIVLGVFRDTRYKRHKIKMSTGEILLIYTDGITEAFDSSFSMYGEARLERLFKRSVKLSAHDIISQIIEDVDTFTGGDNVDDITLVVVKCLS